MRFFNACIIILVNTDACICIANINLDVLPFVNARQFLKNEPNRRLLQKLSTEFIRQFLCQTSTSSCQEFMNNKWLNVKTVLLYSFRQRICGETSVSWYKVQTVGQLQFCYSTCETADLPTNWKKVEPIECNHDLSVYFTWQTVSASCVTRLLTQSSDQHPRQKKESRANYCIHIKKATQCNSKFLSAN